MRKAYISDEELNDVDMLLRWATYRLCLAHVIETQLPVDAETQRLIYAHHDVAHVVPTRPAWTTFDEMLTLARSMQAQHPE